VCYRSPTNVARLWREGCGSLNTMSFGPISPKAKRGLYPLKQVSLVKVQKKKVKPGRAPWKKKEPFATGTAKMLLERT